MANKRITDVDFLSSLDSNESFFVNKNNTIKQISKSNIVVGVENGGTGATNAKDAIKNLNITKESLGITQESLGITVESLGVTPAKIGAQSQHITRTVSLSTSGWASNKQTVTVNGVTKTNTVFSVPHPSYYMACVDSGILCTAQDTNKLTFSCQTVPSNNIQINIVIMN